MTNQAYSLNDLKRLIKEELKSVRKDRNYPKAKVQAWWIISGTDGATLSITFYTNKHPNEVCTTTRAL